MVIVDDLPGPLHERTLDAFPASAAVIDSDGTLVQVNQSWRAVGEQTSTDIFTQSCGADYLEHCERNHQDGTTEIAEHLRGVLAGEDATRALVCPFDGTVADRWFLFRAVGLEHRNQRYALAIFVDISEIQREHLHLRERVQRLETSMSVIAHDLRTPLSLIRGYAELLEDELGESEAFARIQGASARADTIISDALVLAQGTTVSDRETVELRPFVRTVWAELDTLQETAALEIEDSFAFEADPGLLRRILENLFTNAFQHAGPDVTVRIGRLPESASATVGFYVEDDGPGLPTSDVGEVFTPGYTADGQNGYGLGLTIVQAAVEAHGWAITATNGDDGARFEIAGIRPLT